MSDPHSHVQKNTSAAGPRVQRSGEGNDPPIRTVIQFGCLTAIPLITFLLVSVVLLSFLAYDKNLRAAPLEKLTAPERADYELWSAQPIDVTTASAIAVPSPQLQQQKRGFNRRTDQVYEDALDIFESSHTLYNKYKMGEPISRSESIAMQELSLVDRLRRGMRPSTTETARLVERTAPIAALINEARTLTADPAYTAYHYPFDYDISIGQAEQLIAAYCMVKAQVQAWPEAIDALNVLVELYRVPPEVALRSFYAYQLRNLAMFMADRTSDTAVLNSLLENLNRAREVSLHPATPLTFLAPSGIGMLREMHETGYINRYPKTLGEALALRAMERDYGNYLVQVLPATDPRHMRALARKLVSSMSDSRRDIILARLHIGILKPAARRLQLATRTPHVVGMITTDAEKARNITRALVEFDLARVALARNIASLRGEGNLTTSSAFVPEYMSKFPTDLYSNQPLQYDADNDSFYSPGPDGVKGGGDDIYHRPYKLPAVKGLPDIMY